MKAVTRPIQPEVVLAEKAWLTPTAGQHSIRLSSEQLDQLFLDRGTKQHGQLRIRHIRDNLPQRATKTSKCAGKLRYPSHKMGFVLESEAFSTEYVAHVVWEHDDDVQVPEIPARDPPAPSPDPDPPGAPTATLPDRVGIDWSRRVSRYRASYPYPLTYAAPGVPATDPT